MKIQTFSILAGSSVCDAKCPYCVSKMTPKLGVTLKEPEINWRNFEIACRFARQNNVSTVLITGKGEPVLFPDQITDFLEHLRHYKFSFIELQTNGIALFQRYNDYEEYLKEWYKLGLTVIAISIVHYENERNKEIFQPDNNYMDLIELMKRLHGLGFSLRLSTVLFKGFIDQVSEVKKLIQFAQDNKVEQLSIRPVRRPEKSENKKVYRWVVEHELTEKEISLIRKFLFREGQAVLRLAHGAVVFDFNGQNICLTDALTIEPESEEIRQLIFFPNGRLRYDWQYPGAILL